jgi:hypothetical protein
MPSDPIAPAVNYARGASPFEETKMAAQAKKDVTDRALLSAFY